jgi:hypothetical protein
MRPACCGSCFDIAVFQVYQWRRMRAGEATYMMSSSSYYSCHFSYDLAAARVRRSLVQGEAAVVLQLHLHAEGLSYLVDRSRLSFCGPPGRRRARIWNILHAEWLTRLCDHWEVSNVSVQ